MASELFSGLWVLEIMHTSCGLLILVEETAEPVVSFDLADVGRRVMGEWPCGSSLAQGAVRTVIVVVALELA